MQLKTEYQRMIKVKEASIDKNEKEIEIKQKKLDQLGEGGNKLEGEKIKRQI